MLLVDTGVLVAAADTDDAHHQPAKRVLENDPGPLVTNPMVIAETAYLLDRQLGPGAEATLYTSITEGNLQVEDITAIDWTRIRELVIAYADLRLGGTDASLIAHAERFEVAAIAALNRRDFAVVRPRHVGAFELLP